MPVTRFVAPPLRTVLTTAAFTTSYGYVLRPDNFPVPIFRLCKRGQAIPEGSDGLQPSGKCSKPSPQTQRASRRARGILRSPADF
eukprot:8542226-Pyramimonas_sp.AAC.1